MTGVVLVAAGLLGALTVGLVFVVGVLAGRLWDAITGANTCDR